MALTQVQPAMLGTPQPYNFKNRIINGAMVIDQRNAGASVTITVTGDITYTLDRFYAYGSQASKFSVQQNAGSVTPPVGFSKYLGVTSLASTSLGASDYFIIAQRIEGFNTADLGWGTANAKTVTLSFQVYSSLTGTFGGAIQNGSGGRSYPFTYTVSSANTWTTVSVTIAGDTSGTWVGATNGVGMIVNFNLGTGSTYSGTANTWASTYYTAPTGATSVVGTNGATFYITGVQLEVGVSATGFDYRPYGTELALCQRYYSSIYVNDYIASGFANSTTTGRIVGIYYPVPLRTSTPTITLPTAGQSAGNISFTKNDGSYPSATGTHTVPYTTASMFVIGGTGYTGLVASSNIQLYSNGASTIQVSAEL